MNHAELTESCVVGVLVFGTLGILVLIASVLGGARGGR